jgi:Flp pilus assembly protein TadG
MRTPRTSGIHHRGAVAVEAAIILPLLVTLMFGVVVMGMGIYRYQQVAALAREGARYASVHGTQYAADTGNAAATDVDIYNNAILPLAFGLGANRLSYSVTWNTTNSPTSYNPNSIPPGAPLNNSVNVTVTYNWIPELYVAGPINLTSTSTMPMSY